MFGLFKRGMAPGGPVTFDFDTRVARPAADVYPLLDWADPRHQRRQLGDHVECTGTAPDRFRLVMAAIPDLTFDIVLVEAVPASSYAYDCRIIPQVGRLVANREQFTLEPEGDGSCILRLVNEVQFAEPLRRDHLEEECARMGAACASSLEKIRILAEQGLEALRRMEAHQFG